MTVSTFVSMLVGLGIPALVALITREALPAKVKALLLLLLSTATGILSGLVTNPPQSWSTWEHVLLNIVLTYVAAAASLIAGWIPTGANKAIERATDRIGFGPRSAQPPH